MSSAVGQSKKCQMTFVDVNGTATNPTGITARVYRLDPDSNTPTLVQTTVKASMVNPATGVFYFYFTPTVGGVRYRVEWVTDEASPPEVAQVAYFDVETAIP